MSDYLETVPHTYSESFIRNFNVLMSNIHTAMPGTIESYENKIASVKPGVKKKLVDGTYLELPIIHEVPVIFQSTSEFSFTFPLKKGDPVWIMFAERSMEEWIVNGGDASPEDLRRFSLCDAVALPGMFNQNFEFPEVEAEDITIKYKDSSIVITKDGGIKINGIDIIEVATDGDIAVNAGGTVALNGDGKSFVTHTELDTALSTFVTQLVISLQTTPIVGNGSTQVWVNLPTSIDISSSKTTTVKTGG